MRILQINKFHWPKGGSERYYFDLQHELGARGHEVAVFASQNPRNESSGFSSYFAPDADYHRAGVFRGLGLARDVIYNREAARRLGVLIRDFRPQVAHLHNFHHQLSPSILAVLAEARVPVVQTLHDYKWVCPAYLFLSGSKVCERCGPGRFSPVVVHRCHHGSLAKSLVVYRESKNSWKRKDYEKVHRFLAPSRFMRERVIAHGLPPDRIVEMPYFVRESSYRPADRPGDGFLYLGRLSREKGLPTLLEALAGRPGLHLRVAGSGPLEDELRRGARDGSLNVAFLGHLSGDVLHDTIRSARAVVVPSEWYENQPYAILEAFALGVPVIGTSIGGIPELVRHGETGLLVPPGRPEDLGEAMDRLHGRAGEALAMGRNARRRIETDFAASGAIARLIDLYAALRAAAVSSGPGPR